MTEHKIFKPNMLIQNYIKSSWCKNIKTVEDRLPVCQYLKAKGIWAIEIEPSVNFSWYAFGLPVNKNWEPETINTESKLSLSIYNESEFCLNIETEDSKGLKSAKKSITIDDSGDWHEILIDVPVGEIRMILFSGSSATPTYVIKDIVLKY